VIVVDNASDDATREVVQASPAGVEYLPQTQNLGCGGGLACGERTALERFANSFTHLWILDDDAVVEPETLDTLLAALEAQHAGVVHPLVVDGAGQIGWVPGLFDKQKFGIAHAACPPEKYLAECGPDPVPFSWSQGIALLVTRAALDRVGLHRADYLVRGEDLEFSLRITARFPGLFVPQARVQHLPPAPTDEPASRHGEYVKHLAMLRNIAYTALRLPHGRRIARTIPGNWLRFLRTWGWKPEVAGDALTAFAQGALLGKPAGVP